MKNCSGRRLANRKDDQLYTTRLPTQSITMMACPARRSRLVRHRRIQALDLTGGGNDQSLIPLSVLSFTNLDPKTLHHAPVLQAPPTTEENRTAYGKQPVARACPKFSGCYAEAALAVTRSFFQRGFRRVPDYKKVWLKFSPWQDGRAGEGGIEARKPDSFPSRSLSMQGRKTKGGGITRHVHLAAARTATRFWHAGTSLACASKTLQNYL